MKPVPRIIPPRSRVRLVHAEHTTPEWKGELGRQFRIGYYNRKDGLDCIWLVNEKGEYEQTTDRDGLLRYFTIEKLTNERDYYGAHKAKAGAVEKPSESATLNLTVAKSRRHSLSPLRRSWVGLPDYKSYLAKVLWATV